MVVSEGYRARTTERTANPKSTTTPTEGQEMDDSPSEIEQLDVSLSDMTGVLLGDARDDDMDFEGMFAEIDCSPRSTPAKVAADDPHPGAGEESSTDDPDASVSKQLDEIEAAVAAAIAEADAGLEPSGPEVAAATPSQESPELVEEPETAADETIEPDATDGPGAPAAAHIDSDDVSGEGREYPASDADGTMTAVAEDLDSLESAGAAPVSPAPMATRPEAVATSEPAPAAAGPAAEIAKDSPTNGDGLLEGEADVAPESDAFAGVGPSDAGVSAGQRLTAHGPSLLDRLCTLGAGLVRPAFGALGTRLAPGTEALARSFTCKPRVVRQSVAWIALWTLFNACVVWAYLGLFRSAASTPAEGSGTRINGTFAPPPALGDAGATGDPGVSLTPSVR